MWLVSIIYSIIWTFENPEKIEKVKNIFKKNSEPKIEIIEDTQKKVIANSFTVNFTKILDFKDKTAFIIYPNNLDNFDKKNLNIYTQNGYVINNLESKKLNLPKNFTLQRNGGVKTIISING